MDYWERFNEITRKKKAFYSNVNIEDITDEDYLHAKKVCKNFEIKNLSEYHDLYFKVDVSLLADIFENFRKMYFEIYELDPTEFISSP